MTSPQHAVLLMQGSSSYNGLAGYNREVARVLRNGGIEPFIVDVNPTLTSQLEHILKTYPAERIIAAFGFGGIGMELGDDMEEGNLWQRLRIPFLNWQGDHPCYFLKRHKHASPASMRVYISKEFQDFNTTYIKAPYRSGLCQLGARNYGRTPEKRKIKADEAPLLIFPKSGGDPAQLEMAWKRLPTLSQRIIRNAFDHYWGQTARSGSVVPSVLIAADAAGIELRNDLPLFTFFITQIDDFVRRNKTKIVIEDVLSLPVKIYGSNLDYIDTKRTKHKIRASILPPVDYADLTHLFHEALGILTFNPNVDDIVHDRVYSAFGCRAMPISDINPWMKNNYTGLLPYSFDFRDHPATVAVEHLLTDPEKAAHIAWDVGEKACTDWSVEASILKCLELAAMHRALTFNFSPPQNFFSKIDD